jgi:hypothetical protein
MNEYDEDLERLAKKYGGKVVLPEMFNDIQACFTHDAGGYWVSWIVYDGAKRKLARCDLMGEVKSTVEYYPEEGVLQDHLDTAIFGLILTPTDLIAVDSATDG